MKPAIALLLSAICLTTGCTIGTEFSKPGADPSLVLGKTTRAELVQRYGEPKTRTKNVFSDEDAARVHRNATAFDWARVGGIFEEMKYSYSDRTKTELIGTAPLLKAASFQFWNDRLVGYYYLSNFPDDVKELDDRAIDAIVKGKSTLADLEKVFGTPMCASIYPMIYNEDQHEVGYTYYSLWKKGGYYSALAHEIRRLDVILDHDNVVQDYRFYTESD